MILNSPKDIATNSWLKDLPEGWKILRFRDLFNYVGSPSPDDENPILSLTRGGIVERDISGNEGQLAADYSAYPVIEPGSFVLNPMDLIAGWIAISPYKGRISGAYFSFELKRKWERFGFVPRYFELVLQTYYTQRILNPFGVGLGRSESGGGRWTLNRQTLNVIPFPVPPVDEQLRIAAYLDQEFIKINDLVYKEELLINLLKERRAALIASKVTKGLADSAKMEKSKVGWIGDIPAHWRISKVNRAFTLTLGMALNSKAQIDGREYPYLRAANIQEYGVDLSEVKFMTLTPYEAAQRTLKKNDVVIVEGGGGYGRSDILLEDIEGWAFQNHVIRARAKRGQSPRFFNYYVKFLRSIGHFESLSAYATIPNISGEKLGRVQYPILPFEEAEKIADYLDFQIKKIDILISDAQALVQLVLYRKASLVAELVVGGHNERGAA